MSFGDVFDPAAGGPNPQSVGGFPIITQVAAPTTPAKGWAWMNPVTNVLSIFDGVQWVQQDAMPRGTKAGQILTTLRSPWDFEVQDNIDSGRF